MYNRPMFVSNEVTKIAMSYNKAQTLDPLILRPMRYHCAGGNTSAIRSGGLGFKPCYDSSDFISSLIALPLPSPFILSTPSMHSPHNFSPTFNPGLLVWDRAKSQPLGRLSAHSVKNWGNEMRGKNSNHN